MAAARSLEESSVFVRSVLASARPGFWWALGGALLVLLLAT